MQNKKILLIYYKLFKPGGVAKALTNLANELVEQGYNVDVLLLTSLRPHFYNLDARVNLININTFSHWTSKFYAYSIEKLMFIPKIMNINSYIYHIHSGRLLKSWLKNNHHGYQTIISCWYTLSSMLAMWKFVAHKTIAWEHTDYHVGGIIFNKILRKYYKNLKYIVCINSPSLKYYIRFNKTQFIPNIIGKPFENAKFVEYDKKENIISFVGRLDKDKNVIELIEIFNQAQLPDTWKLQIIGEGTQKEILEQKVNEKCLTDKVIFYGNKTPTETFLLLSKSKIFGFTSLKEGLPTVLIEALFTSNTIISYDCNFGPSDIINQDCGFLIPLKNKQLFIEKLKFLVDNPEFLKQLNLSAFTQSQRWKKENILKKWKDIL